MPEVYLFNPDNDLALANGDENYMPPSSARKMADDLSLLPLWYASEGARIITSNSGNSFSWLEHIKHSFGILVELITEHEIINSDSLILCPWGWNATLVKHARQLGFSESSLPDKIKIESIRKLSHRSLSVSLLRELNVSPSYCGYSEELMNDEAVRNFVEHYPRVLLKAPWSGSGKGLRPGKGVYTSHIEGWSNRIIKNQHCVIGEPLFDKVCDFAMEFSCDDTGKVHFAGYSFFETDVRGAYKANLLASDIAIEQRLAEFVSLDDIHSLRDRVGEKLAVLLDGKYKGYLGVDMMVCRFSEYPNYRIHPCVEVNLRMNMGLFSRLFYDRFLLKGKAGSFSVDYFQDSRELLEDHLQKTKNYPLILENRRIASGYLSLTPVSQQTNYRASILVE